MKNNKENHDKKFSIKDLFTNKQYRSIAILCLYFVLFVIIIIGIRAPKRLVDGEGNRVTNLIGYELIDGNNFGYKYSVTVGDEGFYYEGKKYDNKELVTVIRDDGMKEYYFEGDNTYIKENDNYTLTEIKPYLLFDFFNTDILDTIILRSIDLGNHKYKVDNQEIFSVLSDKSGRIEEGDNYINLVYRNDKITGITLDFSTYAKTIGEDYNNIIIDLQYFDFGLIDNFEIDVME